MDELTMNSDALRMSKGALINSDELSKGELRMSSDALKKLLQETQTRLRMIRELRELIADASESLEFARTTSFEGVGNRDALPEGLDAILSRLEGLKEKYIVELKEAILKQELVEKWIDGLELKDKELVRYRFFLGHTVEECAEYFGCTPMSIFKRCKDIFG